MRRLTHRHAGRGAVIVGCDMQELHHLQTVGDLIRWAASRFGEVELCFGHGTDNAADEARVLVFHALHLDFDVPDYFYATRVSEAELQRVATLVEARASTRKPTPYLTNEAWFAGLEFFVDERVLIPRSPIGELIELGFTPWFTEAPPEVILDLCTGSGCIAAACAVYFPDARVTATDIDPAALEVARHNVALHDLTDRVELLESDLFEKLAGRRFDLIVTNPPYVPASVHAALPPEYRHEPAGALTDGGDGLSLVRRIIAEAPAHLSPDGILIIDLGESAGQFLTANPDLGAIVCELERGGEGVLAIAAADLRRGCERAVRLV